MTNPFITDLEPGTYYWCACGKTKTQPYCDGSHEGTGNSPVEFNVTDKKQVALCNCGKTSTPPYCDGSHENLI
jgi:CDGSH-type Zn-finger protein